MPLGRGFAIIVGWPTSEHHPVTFVLPVHVDERVILLARQIISHYFERLNMHSVICGLAKRHADGVQARYVLPLVAVEHA